VGFLRRGALLKGDPSIEFIKLDFDLMLIENSFDMRLRKELHTISLEDF
jgi:hypothetical protein